MSTPASIPFMPWARGRAIDRPGLGDYGSKLGGEKVFLDAIGQGLGFIACNPANTVLGHDLEEWQASKFRVLPVNALRRTLEDVPNLLIDEK